MVDKILEWLLRNVDVEVSFIDGVLSVMLTLGDVRVLRISRVIRDVLPEGARIHEVSTK